MRRSRFMLALCLIGLCAAVSALPRADAQTVTPRAQTGDPPIASLITLSAPDEDGLITITGAAGAVVPNANVIIRNLYTEQTAYAPVGVTGGFSARIYGEGNTPFWISPVQGDIAPENRDDPGSLPGGPGLIVYGAFPIQPAAQDMTALAIDGGFSDWAAIPAARLSDNIRALRSRDALWLSVSDETLNAQPTDGGVFTLRVLFVLNNITFAANIQPYIAQPTPFERLNPNRAALDSLLVASAIQDGQLEARIPLTFLDRIDRASITNVQLLNAENNTLAAYTLPEVEMPFIDTNDAAYRSGDGQIDGAIPFTAAGALGNGASFWSANGLASPPALAPDDTWRAALDVSLRVPGDALPADVLLDIELRLQPIVQFDALGRARYLVDTHTNNGYTTALYADSLPIDNLSGSILAARAQIPASALVRRAQTIEFALDLAFTADEASGLARGLYVPVLIGSVESGGMRERWEFSAFFGEGGGVSRVPWTRLPFVLNIDDADQTRLPLALFYDDPSDGARGIIAAQDADTFALSNRVKHNPPLYVLPPFRDGGDDALIYSLEPYVMNMLPNAYDSTAAPLIPFAFDDDARMTIRVTAPDGSREAFNEMPILQGIASTPALDERALFGVDAPVDVYRLTTLDSRVTRYTFTQYGDYTIDVSVSIRDRDGNRYSGGGTYRVTIAELFDLTPSVLPGTPFTVGESLHAGLRIAPGAPADVTLTVRQFPLNGIAPITREVTGEANAHGLFNLPDESVEMTAPGVYTADYTARYTDPRGRLWAGSARGVGVVAARDNAIIAHGMRGADGVQPALTWYRVRSYSGADIEPARLNFPYFSGDIAWVGESAAEGMSAQVQVQDDAGDYERWLAETIYALTPRAALLQDGLNRDALALITTESHTALAVINAVRPGLSVRQYLAGTDDGTLSLQWDSDDPYNRQIGVGTTGDRPGDFTFLFGGAVIEADDPETDFEYQTTAIYGALQVVIGGGDPRGARVYPPYNGAAGAGDGGALVSIDDRTFDLFFVSSATPPGALLTRGDPITIGGQSAPTLPNRIHGTVTSPSGQVVPFDGRANAVGYFYDPAFSVTADEIGVWTIDIVVTGDAPTAHGLPEPPYPTGSVLRPFGTRYNVYVLPETPELLSTTVQLPDVLIPTGVPYNFAFTIPADWTEARAYVTLTTPSYILTDDSVPINGRTIAYAFNPALIRGSFPNIENEPRGQGSTIVDPLVLTIVAAGLDSSGTPQVQARQYTLFYNRLMQISVPSDE